MLGLCREIGCPDACDEFDLGAEPGKPHRLVGARAARTRADRCTPVRAAHQRTLGQDHDVRHHVADDEDLARAHPRLRAARASAIAVATRTLFSTSAILETRLLPPVSSMMRLRRYGVSALPPMPSRSASATAA